MRQQHYRFAHQHLKDLFLRDPAGFWSAATAEGPALLARAWAASGEGLGPNDRADGSGLSFTPVSPAPGVEGLLITLPPPMDAAECYYIALVKVDGGPPRYFVAERGVDGPNGAPRAYWAEHKVGPGGAVMRVRGEDLPAIGPEALLAAATAECRGAPAGPPGQGAFAMAAAPQGAFGAPMGPPQGAFGAPMGPPPGAFGAPMGPPQGAFGGPLAPPPMGPGWSKLPPAPRGGTSKAAKITMIGCGGFVAFLVITGAIMLYLEEGRDLYGPTSEEASVPVSPGVPFAIETKWDGIGFVHHNIFLVVEDGTTAGGSFRVSGAITCQSSSTDRKVEASLTDRNVYKRETKGASGFSAWLHLESEYTHSSPRPVRCQGTLTPSTGTWTKGRIVITQLQRPSDFFAF